MDNKNSKIGIFSTIIVVFVFVSMLSVMEQPIHYFDWQKTAIEFDLPYDTKENTLKEIDSKYCSKMMGIGVGWSGKACTMPYTISDLRDELKQNKFEVPNKNIEIVYVR